MAKMTCLKISNFKFFGLEKPLEIKDGNHLLIYGENGSGKSTIYWALYTLLESASKSHAPDIQKYFRRGQDEKNSLVNIYATTSTGIFDTHVEVELDNKQSYRVSYTDTVLHQNQAAQLSNMVSDFMNYRLLYKVYDFSHSKEINLYDLFWQEVLPYVNFTSIEIGVDKAGNMQYERRAHKILSKLWEGPGVVANHKGDRILPHQNSAEYRTYLSKTSQFNNDLNNLLSEINIKGNEILKTAFGYRTFDFELGLAKKAGIDKKDKRFDIIYPEITLRIKSYNGIGIIHKPHSFLNEAKLSAIALAIRLSVMEINYDSTAELKLLVLDDLLLSLDMQNRDSVVELLLEKYVQKYQIVLLTHDYNFFKIVKKRLNAKEQQKDWTAWEMYAEEPEGGRPRPFFVKSESYLEQARKHLSQKDYEVAGNYLRKEAERWVKGFLPRRRQLGRDLSELNLSAMITQAIEFGKKNNMSATAKQLFVDLNEHREFIFNPLSHDSYDVSRLRKDVHKAIETLETLNNIGSKTILSIGDELKFELKTANGDVTYFKIELCDELKILKEPTIDAKLSNCPFFVKYQTWKAGNAKPEKEQMLNTQNDLEKFYNFNYDKSDKTANNDFKETILLKDGNPLKSKF